MKTRMKTSIVALATILFCIAIAIAGILPAQSARASAKSKNVEKGHKLFTQYCAACHGVDGKGGGPAAAALKVAPPDLTAIQQSGEKFPFYQVQTKIDGEKAVTAHGTSKMPVWGTIFRHTNDAAQQQMNVHALVKYVESIQRTK